MKEKKTKVFVAMVVLASLLLFAGFASSASEPTGPDNINFISNESGGGVSGKKVNISGGVIATMNLSTTVQNSRWKAFVGNVTGSFTLDDAEGSTIYDWSLSVTTGRVYSTRNETTPAWTSIACANEANLEEENQEMNHTNPGDNITATFDDTTHSAFYVGPTFISDNSCPTLNTYQNDASQDSVFEEMALYDTTNIIYATILEDDVDGFDGNPYDFQMIVPENGGESFEGSTAYYLYVELD